LTTIREARRAAHAVDRRAQTRTQVLQILIADLLFRSRERRLHAFALERFQHVVERVRVEGAQRILVVRPGEDQRGHALGADGLHHAEAVETG
jgi:hypothetical protein